MFVITGGGIGIGMHLAIELSAREQEVLIIGRNSNNLQTVASRAKNIDYLASDVSCIDGREEITQRLTGQTIQGFVHNAGIIKPIIDITSISLTEWHQCMATNLDAPLFLTKSLLKELHGGRVLHIGSGAAYFPMVGCAAYCVSKAALSMLTKSLQKEVADISFASVMPGIIDTGMQEELRAAAGIMDAAKHEFFMRLHREDKLLKPEVVASFLAWLLLDVDSDVYSAKEWDIYDTSHHSHWLKNLHQVPGID